MTEYAKGLLIRRIFESVIIYIYSNNAKFVLLKRKIGLLLIHWVGNGRIWE